MVGSELWKKLGRWSKKAQFLLYVMAMERINGRILTWEGALPVQEPLEEDL